MENTKVCIRCGKEKPLEKFKWAWNKRYRKNQCAACCSRWYIAKFKLDFLAAFGGKCSCCGERNPYFLTLDHVNNDGAEHRRRMAQVAVLMQARREGFDKTKYDCLCMNCNFAKGHYGICPHKAGLSPEDVTAKLQAETVQASRKHVHPSTMFTGGFDPRRMQLNRRILKPCPYCDKEFGTNEMTRHKRAEHVEEMKQKRAEALAIGHGWNRKAS